MGYRIVRPNLALIRCKDGFHYDPRWEALKSKGVRVHQFRQHVRDRGNAREVVKGLCGHCPKDTRNFMEPIVLGDLKGVDEALLTPAGVPNWGPICEYGDNEGVVDFAPIEEVEALDRVAEDADPADGRVGTVGHDLDMGLLVEVAVDEHPKKAKGGGGSDVLGP